jgi:hypothetical protein
MELLPLPMPPLRLRRRGPPMGQQPQLRPQSYLTENPIPVSQNSLIHILQSRLTIKIHRFQMNPSRYQLHHLWMLMVTMLNPSNNNLFLDCILLFKLHMELLNCCITLITSIDIELAASFVQVPATTFKFIGPLLRFKFTTLETSRLHNIA